MRTTKQTTITLPKSIVEDLKDGWTYQLSWNYENNEFNLQSIDHYPIKEQKKDDKRMKRLIKRNKSIGALPQTPKFI